MRESLNLLEKLFEDSKLLEPNLLADDKKFKAYNSRLATLEQYFQ